MYDYRCTVIKIIDGDTADVSVDLGFRISMKMRFRLTGINAPELRTEEGVKSKARLEELMPIGETLHVVTNKDSQEKFGRYLGTFWRETGQSINARMTEEGFAVPYGPKELPR